LFDVDFLMSQFDEDVRRLVQVKVVHGSWKKDAPNRIRIEVCFSVFSSCTRISLCDEDVHQSRKHVRDIRMLRR
jgi:hypothetical protein